MHNAHIYSMQLFTHNTQTQTHMHTDLHIYTVPTYTTHYVRVHTTHTVHTQEYLQVLMGTS